MTDSIVVPGGSADDTPAPITGISDEAVDKTRAWTGLYVVIGGDVAIAVAVAIALIKFAGTAGQCQYGCAGFCLVQRVRGDRHHDHGLLWNPG